MNKCQGIKLVGLVAATVMANVQADTQPPQTEQQMKAQLEQAKEVLLEAEKTAEEIIRSAQEEARKIRQGAENIALAETDLEPLAVQNQRVSIEVSAGTIQEIVTKIMPSDWRVLVDVKDQSIIERRFQFVSNRTREQALNDLLKPIGMKHQYFFDLKDSQGNRSPLLVVSVER